MLLDLSYVKTGELASKKLTALREANTGLIGKSLTPFSSHYVILLHFVTP